jgi:hypothetical protein
MLIEARDDLDEIARAIAVVELVHQDIVPGILAGAGGARQAENVGCIGDTSRPVKPVPPVVTTTSIAGDAIHSCTRARMVSTSSGTMLRSATTCPASLMRSESVAPDLSSASSRVSDTVSTANFNGTNCLF